MIVVRIRNSPFSFWRNSIKGEIHVLIVNFVKKQTKGPIWKQFILTNQTTNMKKSWNAPFEGSEIISHRNSCFILVVTHSINIQCLKWEEVKDNNAVLSLAAYLLLVLCWERLWLDSSHLVSCEGGRTGCCDVRSGPHFRTRELTPILGLQKPPCQVHGPFLGVGKHPMAG